MRLNQKQLLNLPVYTRSGNYLGRVVNFELDSETHQLIKYCVGSSSWLKNLLGSEQELLIAPAQVQSISEEKMVVSDSVLREDVKDYRSVVSKAAAPVAPLQKNICSRSS